MILGEMLMDMSSWNSSLQAYGISICEICREKNHNDTRQDLTEKTFTVQ